MKIIIITLPEFFEGETALVNRLFEQGKIERLHLRKPKATEQQMAGWIEQIALPFRHLIVLHDHHQLAYSYKLGGIHLNSRNPDVPMWTEELQSQETLQNAVLPQAGTASLWGNFTISRSCHSLNEVRRYKKECDYLFLSPIYDSISKEDYGAAFSREELAEAKGEGLLQDNVIALGGISPDKLAEVELSGFAGAAMLGAFWQENIPRQ